MASLRIMLCVAVAVLFAVFQTSTSLDCVKCKDGEGAGCKNNNTGNVTCDTKEDQCLKIDYDDGTTYERRCGTEKICKLYANCEMCKENGCNSAPSMLPSFLVLGAASVIVAKYFY